MVDVCVVLNLCEMARRFLLFTLRDRVRQLAVSLVKCPCFGVCGLILETVWSV